jgi:hypothetical protein
MSIFGYGNQPQQGYSTQTCPPGCTKNLFGDLFSSSQQQPLVQGQYPQQQQPGLFGYGGKLSKKAKKGGSVKPFCPSVWSNQAPFPAAVGGKRKSKKQKMRKSSGTMKKSIPDISKIAQQGMVSASSIGGKMGSKSRKTLKEKKGTSNVSSLDVLRAANQASAAAASAAMAGGRKRKHKRSSKSRKHK